MKGTTRQSDSYCDYVLDQLGEIEAIECRAMFGGHGLYVSGVFFAIVFRGCLYFRTDEQSREEYVRCGMEPFTPNSRQTLRSYYEVPVDVLEDRDKLLDWAQIALAANVSGRDAD